jgi:hypothetical protein
VSQQINLFNPLLRKQKKYFSAVTMAQALAMVLVGVMLFSAYINYQLRVVTKQEAELSHSLQSSQKALEKLAAVARDKKRDAQLEAEVVRLSQQIASREKVLKTLQSGSLGNTKGFSEHLRALSRQSVHGLWLTGFVIAGAADDTEISGRTLQPELVPVYINRLKQEPALQGKSFDVLEMHQPKPEGEGKDKKEPTRYLEFSLRSAVQEKAADATGATAK